MTSTKLALGSLSLLWVLEGCTSTPTCLAPTHTTTMAATTASNECPPMFGKVCYGSMPGTLKCGCSTVSPLGTPYQ